MKIAILGGGSWGTALAVHLARKKHDISVWEFFTEQAQEMQEKRVCKLLPEVKLPENIFVSDDMGKILTGSELVLMVVPSDKVEATLNSAQNYLNGQDIVICSKGFANDLQLLSDIVNGSGSVFCLYGPTHAEEVGKGMFSGIVLAGEKEEGRTKIAELFATDNFKVDTTSDLVGVQVAAALKNIVAVFIGVLDGMGSGDNAKAYIMTRGLAEIKQVGLAWGAKEETFTGLAGMGDLIVTCNSEHSRNRHVGVEVGKGKKLDSVISEMNMVAEGVTTLKEAIGLKEKFGLELPLITALYEILFNGQNPEKMLRRI